MYEAYKALNQILVANPWIPFMFVAGVLVAIFRPPK